MEMFRYQKIWDTKKVCSFAVLSNIVAIRKLWSHKLFITLFQSVTANRLAAAHRGTLRALQVVIHQLSDISGGKLPPSYKELAQLIRHLSLCSAKVETENGSAVSDTVLSIMQKLEVSCLRTMYFNLDMNHEPIHCCNYHGIKCTNRSKAEYLYLYLDYKNYFVWLYSIFFKWISSAMSPGCFKWPKFQTLGIYLKVYFTSYQLTQKLPAFFTTWIFFFRPYHLKEFYQQSNCVRALCFAIYSYFS